MCDFAEYLQKQTDDYDGPYAEFIAWVPKLFNYFAALLEDKRTPATIRMLLHSAISYLVLPFDIVPESSLGAFGLMDDLFVCAYICNAIYKDRQIQEVLIDNWPYQQEIKPIICHLLAKCEEVISTDEQTQILIFAGLLETTAELHPVR